MNNDNTLKAWFGVMLLPNEWFFIVLVRRELEIALLGCITLSFLQVVGNGFFLFNMVSLVLHVKANRRLEVQLHCAALVAPVKCID